MGKVIDITNQKFGKITALYDTGIRKNRQALWHCKCDCGNECDILGSSLRSGHTTSCGCKRYESKAENLIGQKFSELKVIERDYDYERHKKNRTSYWLCECSCGNKIILSRTSLVNNSRYACDFCSKGISTGEKIIQNILDENDIIYKKQVTFRDLFGINNGHCKFDFGIYSRNNDLIKLIEYDGEFHYMKVDYLNSETVKQNDIIKNNYCLTHNIPLVRIPYWEKENINLDMILGDEFLWQKTEK